MSCNKSGSTYIFMQAVRGTQRGARFLHEGRVEEAIREFHSVCNRVPRRFVGLTGCFVKTIEDYTIVLGIDD